MTEENITRMSIAEIRAKVAAGGDRTDWARVDTMTDEEIEAAMRDDPAWKDHLDDDWSKAHSVIPQSNSGILIKPIDWKTDGRSMWEDADFPRYDLYRTGSGGYWLAYADRTIRYSPNERDFPSEEAAKAEAQAHKEKRIRAEIDHAAPIATVAIMGVGGARYLMPHPPDSCDDIPVGMPLYACPVFNDENARLREALEKCVVALEALWRTGVNGYAEEIEIARAALKGGAA